MRRFIAGTIFIVIIASTMLVGLTRGANGASYSWVSIGCGLVNSLSWNGTNLYAGSDDGHVYRYDGGTTWTDIGDTTGTYVYSLAWNGINLYAGCAGHVYRYDGGTTWTDTAPGIGSDVFALIWNGTNLFAGSDDGHVYRYDGGTTWTDIGDVTGSSPVYSLAWNGTSLYAGCNDGDVYRYDGGTTWTDTGGTGGSSVICLLWNGTSLYAGGNNGHVFSKTGSGSWTDTGDIGTSYVSSLAWDGTSLYAGGGNDRVYSKTGPGSWTDMGATGGTFINCLLWNGTSLYAGCTNGVMRATRGPSTFYFAEGTCRPNFDPYFCIQNPGGSDAAVTITYMKGNGTTDSQNVNVPKNSRVTVAARDKLGTGDDQAYDFSAKVECTNGQDIIAERPMYFNYKGIWTGGHDVIGATSTSSTYYFAEGTCRPGFDPYFCIQNPGDIDASVTLTYMLGDGTTTTQDVKVPKNARATVNPRDKLGTGDDAAHDFSAKVECTNEQDIIVERPMYFNYKGIWTGGHDVIGATSASSTFYFAEGTCRPNFDPYFCIQNPGGSDAAVTITYMKGNGTTDSQNVNVPKNSRVTVAARDKLGTGDDQAHDFSAKVECTNGQDIIAERPMYFNYKGAWTGGHDVIGASH